MYGKILTVASLAAVATALPSGSNKFSALAKRYGDSYTYYQGDGSDGAGWPDQSVWGSWDDLWATNSAVMANTCGYNNWGADDSTQEISDVGTAIQAVAGTTGVDARFILAIVMQESKGCVRVPTTNNGVSNPGLMQDHNGTGTCAGVNPCPYSEIEQMITDGTAGTPDGDGLQQTLANTVGTTGSGSRNFYAAARQYNSGSVDYANLDDGLGSTACYASDVANRLTGWVLAASSCA